MQLGISTASFYPLEPEKALKQLCEWEIPNTEVFINAKCELKTDYLKEMRKQADDSNMNIVSMHPYSSSFEPLMFFTDYERRFNDSLEEYKAYFEGMNILGAEIFVFHGDSKLNPVPDKFVYERFYKLCQVGKEFGITVAHENVDRCKGHSIEFLYNMKEYLHNDVAFVFDNKQARRGEVDYREYIDKLGENIVHVHLSDNKNSKECCLPIGKGDADLVDLLARLKEKNYNKAVLVELYNDVLTDNYEIYESYENLTKLLKRGE